MEVINQIVIDFLITGIKEAFKKTGMVIYNIMYKNYIRNKTVINNRKFVKNIVFPIKTNKNIQYKKYTPY